MKFRQLINEKFFKWIKHYQFDKPFEIVINPSKAEAIRIVKDSGSTKGLRGLFDKKGNLYIWIALLDHRHMFDSMERDGMYNMDRYGVTYDHRTNDVSAQGIGGMRGLSKKEDILCKKWTKKLFPSATYNGMEL